MDKPKDSQEWKIVVSYTLISLNPKVNGKPPAAQILSHGERGTIHSGPIYGGAIIGAYVGHNS